MQATILIFERKTSEGVLCTTLGLGPETRRRFGRNPQKTHTKLIDDVRVVFRKASPALLMRYEPVRGTRLQRVRLQLTLTGGRERRKVAGLYPIVLEPRWVSREQRVTFAFHPDRPEEVVPIREDEPLESQLRAWFQSVWSLLAEHELDALPSHGRERLHHLTFSFTPRSLMEDLPGQEQDLRASDGDDPAHQRKRRKGMKVLPDLGIDLTERATRDDLDAGTPRAPFRDQLRSAVASPRAPSVVVVGPPRSGKTTLIHQLVLDLLEEDGFSTHRDAQRVRHVWRVSGRRLIAGMSRIGDWEKRCVNLVQDARRRVVLVVDDLHAFGRIGRSRQSDRSLADLFRGPLAQREIVMVGECTPGQWRQLEQDAPAFRSVFTPLNLPEADRHETFRLLVRTLRRVERDHRVAIEPSALRAVVDVSDSVLTHEALPGKALDMLEDLARANPGSPERIGSLVEADVMRLVSRRTGVPESLLRPNQTLDPSEVEASLAARVMGQSDAIRHCVDRVAGVKARLVDPRRPYGVLLFTGPTGVGKTELAKALAEVLYGNERRIVRLDMGEFGGPDAAARLIGDRWRPDGTLTRQVRQQPFSLVLLDEIEKAHPMVHQLLLQLFEDGRLTDAAGQTASFQHTVVVMTSNLGARPKEPIGFGSSADSWMREIAGAVRSFFSPELFNRIDAIVPFRPLDRETAERVAEKEMGKLLHRRGLTDRNVFVQVSGAVTAQVARQAYSPLDGARSIKRYLEDRLGGLLTDVLASGERAAITLLRIDLDEDGRFDVRQEKLHEAELVDARWPLEPLVGLPRGQLVEQLVRLRPTVAALEESPDLAYLSDRLRYHLHRLNLGDSRCADTIYTLDAMRASVGALRERIDALSVADDEDEYDAIERRQFAWTRIVQAGYGEYRVRLLETRGFDPNEKRASRHELLACIGEALALSRALRKVDEPDQHAVVIQMSDVGPRTRSGSSTALSLIDELARRYARIRGTLDSWAIANADGELRTGNGPKSFEEAAGGAVDVALRIVGLCVADFYLLEHGVHVWTRHQGPQIVRVEVLSAEDDSPQDMLIRRRDARATFEQAPLESKPPNPDALLPVVRLIHYDPPMRDGRAELEVEDYPMGFVATLNARRLRDAWDPIWLLRAAREDQEGAST